MTSPKRILLLPGDGIGPEVMSEVRRVLRWAQSERHIEFHIEEDHFGGAAYDAYGQPLADQTLQRAREVGCVILGAVGSPRYDKVPYSLRPEAGLLRLRRELGLFANLRPAMCFDALVEASTLKPEFVRGLDILFVRELTGGVYFGEPRGIEVLPNGSRRGVNTHTYTSEEIRRVARIAFELARSRSRRVVSVDKGNVMEAGLLWNEEVQALRDTEYTDIELSRMMADNCAMQLVRKPRQFDVILTDNLFGDILSDEASMLTGSLGMLPSAALGALPDNGPRAAVYEPIHGSAPDIAGKGIANPCAAILSLAMALRCSFGLDNLAAEIEAATQRTLSAGIRTPDIALGSIEPVGTIAFTDGLLQSLERTGNSSRGRALGRFAT
jgi:3-isopropylmalate dehydrogenase